MTGQSREELLAKKRAYEREWRAKNKGLSKQRQERYAAANPERSAALAKARKARSDLKRKTSDPVAYRRWAFEKSIRFKFGLTVEDYARMLVDQDYRCAGCGGPFTEERGAHVDHDHATGAVRGMLHGACNTALGLACDNPVILRQLAAYLEARR